MPAKHQCIKQMWRQHAPTSDLGKGFTDLVGKFISNSLDKIYIQF